MPKFLLIEHNLRGLGGHYFEYARELLLAAEAAGFEPVVATNRDFQDTAQFPNHARVYPLFDRRRSTLHCAPRYPLRRIAKTLRGEDKRASRVGAFARQLGEEAGIQYSRLRTWSGSKRTVEMYLQSCSKLLDEVPLGEGDLVFVSTCDDLNLTALGRLLSERKEATRATWHLQFHFRIYNGRDPDYAAQANHVAELARRVRAAFGGVPRDRLHFYTTTDELTRQYLCLGVGDVTTLPWPVGTAFRPKLQDREDRGRPLRLVLPGALRREKGKRFVAPFVRALKEEPDLRSSVQLLVQTQPHKGRKLLKAIADDVTYLEEFRLQDLPETPVIVLPCPLSSAQYLELVQGADIGLLPYDPDEYFGRASGALGEFFGTATPVIVPGGSSLSNEIEAANQEYLAQLGSEDSPKRWHLQSSELRGEIFQLDAPALPGPRDLFVTLRVRDRSGPGNYLRVRCTPFGADNQRGDPQNTVLEVRDEGWMRFLCPLHDDTRSVQLQVLDLFHSAPVRLEEMTLEILRPAQAHRPRGKIGLSFDFHDDLPARILEALRDIVAHYDHYRTASRAFADPFREVHAATKTIATLASKSRTRASASS